MTRTVFSVWWQARMRREFGWHLCEGSLFDEEQAAIDYAERARAEHHDGYEFDVRPLVVHGRVRAA